MKKHDEMSDTAESETLKWLIIKGWTGMLFLLVLMMITDLIEFGMRGDFSPLVNDPGLKGLWFIAVVACFNLLGQMYVIVARSRASRWAIFSFSSIYTLVFMGHQVTHMVGGEGFDIHSLLDVSHHMLGIWASIAAYRLAKQ